MIRKGEFTIDADQYVPPSIVPSQHFGSRFSVWSFGRCGVLISEFLSVLKPCRNAGPVLLIQVPNSIHGGLERYGGVTGFLSRYSKLRVPNRKRQHKVPFIPYSRTNAIIKAFALRFRYPRKIGKLGQFLFKQGNRGACLFLNVFGRHHATPRPADRPMTLSCGLTMRPNGAARDS